MKHFHSPLRLQTQRSIIARLVGLLLLLLLSALASFAQQVTDPSDDPGYDEAKSALVHRAGAPQPGTAVSPATPECNSLVRAAGEAFGEESATTTNCFWPRDARNVASPRHDDGSFGPINLPFAFDLYGSSYNQAWINTNGNLTFTNPYSIFSSTGFPATTPMVAPFWADVDTRNPASGVIYYKLSATNLIVTWENVGYFSSMADKRSTFQAIIGTTNDPVLGPNQNVSLRYGDMQWTTGLASSGVNGFGGVPATVGINKGNGSNYVQVGRFNLNSSAYDGPGGANDGVSYLDGQCFSFNASNALNMPPSANNIPANNTVRLACGQSVTISPQFLAPEVNQTVSIAVDTGGLCSTAVSITNGMTATASITITGAACNVGTHQLVLTATDSGTPAASTTVTLDVVVSTCCNLQLAAHTTSVTCPGGTDGAIDLTASNTSGPVSYLWSDGSTSEDLSSLHPGTYSVSVTDANGCTEMASYTIGQVDGVRPGARGRNLTVQLDGGGQAAITPAQVDNGSSDNCGFELSLDRYWFDCSNIGTNAVTLIVRDAAGNLDSTMVIVTVQDTISPGVSAPDPVAVSTAAGQCSAGGVDLGNATASDNCTGFTVTNDAPSVFAKGTTIVTWTATDASGNTATATQEVTVTDNENPSIAAPNDVVVSTDAGQCGAASVALGVAAASDNCVGVTITNDAPAAFAKGNTIVTWTATDAAGHTATAMQIVSIVDMVPPVLTAPAAVTVSTNAGQCSAASVALGTATASDNCSIVTITNNAPAAFAKGTTVVTWTATDAAGNIVTAAQEVTVSDNEQPGLSLPAAIVVSAPATRCEAVVSFSPTATDNCPGVTLTSSPASGSTFPVGSTTVSVTATDAAGNMRRGSFTVRVNDVTAPTVVTRNVTVTLVNGAASITAAQINNGSTDACGIASLSLSRSSFNCAARGNNTVTLTVTDVHGNVGRGPATVTVSGSLPTPAIAVSGSSGVYTGGLANTLFLGYGAQTARLTASGGVSYRWTPALGLSNTSIANPLFTPPAAGWYAYTVTATNQYGCTATASVTLRVVDARCGNKNDKVLVCHNGHEICISPNAVPAHLNSASHDDYLGSCSGAGSCRAVSPGATAQATDEAQATAPAAGELLLEAFPNPFGASTMVHFRTAETTAAQVCVYNQLGQLVATLFDAVAERGHDYSLRLNAEHLATGVYLCRFVSPGQVRVQRLTVVK
jgi:hypothetical protein